MFTPRTFQPLAPERLEVSVITDPSVPNPPPIARLPSGQVAVAVLKLLDWTSTLFVRTVGGLPRLPQYANDLSSCASFWLKLNPVAVIPRWLVAGRDWKRATGPPFAVVGFHPRAAKPTARAT